MLLDHQMNEITRQVFTFFFVIHYRRRRSQCGHNQSAAIFFAVCSFARRRGLFWKIGNNCKWLELHIVRIEGLNQIGSLLVG